jgi:hypothetical protein
MERKFSSAPEPRATPPFQFLGSRGRELPGDIGAARGQRIAVRDESLANGLSGLEDVGVLAEVRVVAYAPAPLASVDPDPLPFRPGHGSGRSGFCAEWFWHRARNERKKQEKATP